MKKKTQKKQTNLHLKMLLWMEQRLEVFGRVAAHRSSHRRRRHRLAALLFCFYLSCIVQRVFDFFGCFELGETANGRCGSAAIFHLSIDEQSEKETNKQIPRSVRKEIKEWSTVMKVNR